VNQVHYEKLIGRGRISGKVIFQAERVNLSVGGGNGDKIFYDELRYKLQWSKEELNTAQNGVKFKSKL